MKTRASEIQASFRELDWIAPLPDHFFHVSVQVTKELDISAAARVWADIPPFSIHYRRVNCFHDAVIVEAHAQGVTELVRRGLPEANLRLLPHMTIGYVRSSERADRLREALRPFRDTDLGAGMADEVLLCEVPVGKSTFLRPWRLVGTVTLDG
ncbi:MAG TPA: hypothetical protein VGJ23_02685 [Gaiellaceae bacterium]